MDNAREIALVFRLLQSEAEIKRLEEVLDKTPNNPQVRLQLSTETAWFIGLQARYHQLYPEKGVKPPVMSRRGRSQ